MKSIKILSFLLLTCVLILPACKDDDNAPNYDPCDPGFDQASLLRNVAENIILPAYYSLQTKVNELSDQADAFVQNPSETSLASLRTAWLDAYLAWQVAAPFEFGPAENVFLRSSLNNFPTDASVIDANILSGTYDFSLTDTYDKGFPAIDYLLYGIANDDASIVQLYADTDATDQYLSDVVADIKQRVTQTVEGWEGNYFEGFIADTGTAAGKPMSLLINNFNQHYEIIKREKIGIPSGVLTLNFTNPEKVEAYYSGQSLDLALAALRGSFRLYKGESLTGNDRQGFDDYLKFLQADSGGTELNEDILSQFTAAIEQMESLGNPLSETIENDVTPVETTYNELVKQLVNIKTDLPSLLCISITYIDNPSDSD